MPSLFFRSSVQATFPGISNREKISLTQGEFPDTDLLFYIKTKYVFSSVFERSTAPLANRVPQRADPVFDDPRSGMRATEWRSRSKPS